jgi:hypothetical protein
MDGGGGEGARARRRSVLGGRARRHGGATALGGRSQHHGWARWPRGAAAGERDRRGGTAVGGCGGVGARSVSEWQCGRKKNL